MNRLLLNLALVFVSINAALLIYVYRHHIFVFESDWWQFVGWFVLWLLPLVLLGLRCSKSLNLTQSVVTVWQFLTIGALTFKYLAAPFLYEPFRSYFVYAFFIAFVGIGQLGIAGFKTRFKISRPFVRAIWLDLAEEIRRPTTTSIIFAICAILVLLAKPSGFQDRYIHWMRDLKFWAFNYQDTLPYTLQPIPAGLEPFDQPLQVISDPLSENHIVVLERSGKIKRVAWTESNSLHTVVLDLSDRLGELGAERALVSAAWHPKFPKEPYIFIAYSHFDGESYTNRLSRFTVANSIGTENEPWVIDEPTELVLIDSLDRHNWHNGGGLAFGPDGFLYYGVGDEGNNNDAHQNSQKIDHNLFSGILRLDVDQRGGNHSHPIRNRPKTGLTQHYYIPSSNPFVGIAGALEEFYAIGMRNPYRLSFDPQGRPWAIDVGQNRYEEINIVSAGGNYGWSYKEGPAPNGGSHWQGKPPNYIGTEVDPFYFYPHSGAQICIVGGAHYTGKHFPDLKGKYIYADLSGEIYALSYTENGVQDNELIAVALNTGQGVAGLGQVGDEVFAIVLGSETESTGGIFTLAKAKDGAAPLLERTVSIDEKYSQMCSRCHGADGNPPELEGGVQPRRFSDVQWQANTTDAAIAMVIIHGGAAASLSDEMPPWKGVLNQQEVEAMVQKIRSFAQQVEGNNP